MSDLDALSALYDWCMAKGLPCVALRVGALSIELAAPLSAPARPTASEPSSSPSDGKDEARRSLEVLLHSSGSDPSALLSRLNDA